MASQAQAFQLEDISVAAPFVVPSVLVIDSDEGCLSHCTLMLNELGYRHYCATTAREALELISRDPSIQILVAATHMPSMDGFVMIEEARARSCGSKAIAAIMLTTEITSELAVKGMHAEAVDMLGKPLEAPAYSAALRRAMRYLSDRQAVTDGASIVNFGQQIARLTSMLEGRTVEPLIDGKLTDQQISTTLRTIIASRALRGRFFPSQLFADPAWDILLDLTRAKLDTLQVSVSSVCIAASVPMSTALRWVRQMTDAGLLRRWTDPKDRRRDLIALTDDTADNMRRYISAVHIMLQKL